MKPMKIDLPGMKVPDSITFDGYNIYVDGVAISLSLIPQALYELVHPDPRKWYRFERWGDQITVHVKISEEGNNGKPIANIGHSESSPESPVR